MTNDAESSKSLGEGEASATVAFDINAAAVKIVKSLCMTNFLSKKLVLDTLYKQKKIITTE